MLKIKEVADIVGVSVRTLHHYDQIGLLKPKKLEENGYRLYNEKDLDRLQQILFFKEMEVPLRMIKRILDDPFFDQMQALKVHKELLLKKRDRLDRIIDSINSSMDKLKGGREMKDQERNKFGEGFAVFLHDAIKFYCRK
ncbi:MerR family transcriptional regulator [Salipaludibacillus sp. CF4.18]|uniref:MerR family transcriptional regulator n=1 Tax=Salipaludibacillus sp. CF4.18 TaxID=3373081 RepID=UPI003EE66EA2